MNYTLTPSLEHIALVKIVTTLWNQDDIRALIPQFFFQFFGNKRREKWQEIENEVIRKVPQLTQPESLKEKILGAIKPIGLQILKWMEYHAEHCYLDFGLPNKLFWTPIGTVDKKKTAEVLIKDESLDIFCRYKLGCIYCLENDILELWNKITENRRKFVFWEGNPRKLGQQELVVLWTLDIKGEVARMKNMIERRWPYSCSPYQFAFEYAALGGNKVATEYFLQKQTSREREETLFRTTRYVAKRCRDAAYNSIDLPKEYYADVLCFLLSQMNEEQQIKVFKSHPYVLIFLLDWPWQIFFLETANRMWDFLSEDSYDSLLRSINNKVITGYKDYNYQMLFREFWQQSPDSHKKYIIDLCASGGSLLSDLFKVEDRENIKLILKDATPAERERIISCNGGKITCESLFYTNKWDLLKFFIVECISSENAMIKLKKEFKERIICNRSKECAQRKSIWNKFFQLLDDLIHNDDKKRRMEEGDSSPAKRLCNTEFEEVRCIKK